MVNPTFKSFVMFLLSTILGVGRPVFDPSLPEDLAKAAAMCFFSWASDWNEGKGDMASEVLVRCLCSNALANTAKGGGLASTITPHQT